MSFTFLLNMRWGKGEGVTEMVPCGTRCRCRLLEGLGAAGAGASSVLRVRLSRGLPTACRRFSLHVLDARGLESGAPLACVRGAGSDVC